MQNVNVERLEEQEALKRTLSEGIAALCLELSAVQLNQLLAYLALMIKWNRAYNLSAIRDPQTMVVKHLLDSLALASYIGKDRGQNYIDVGTGAGLPGIPLAIALPHKHFSLLDSAGKKTRFLFQVQQELGLDNVAVENCRVERFQPEEGFDGVLSRAFASLAEMTELTRHLLNQNGKFWAMKGVFPEDELSKIAKHYIVDQHHPLDIPGQVGARCLLVIAPLPPEKI